MSGLAWTEWLFGGLWCLNVVALLLWLVAYAIRPVRAARGDVPVHAAPASPPEIEIAAESHTAIETASETEAETEETEIETASESERSEAESRLAADIRRWRERHGPAAARLPEDDLDVLPQLERREQGHGRAAG